MTERNALNDRPTPETNQYIRAPNETISNSRFDFLCDHARRLEQQRDAAVEALIEANNALAFVADRIGNPKMRGLIDKHVEVLRAIKEGK